jgi:signal transduction histidine kinase
VRRTDGTEQPPRPPFLHRVSPRQLQILDLIIAAFLVVVMAHAAFGPHQAVSVVTTPASSQTFLGPVNVIWSPASQLAIFVPALGAGAAIALRRRAPMTALALMTASIAAGAGAGVSPALDPFVAFPVYQVASTYERRRSLLALVIAVVLFVGTSLIRAIAVHHGNLETLAFVAAVAAWFVGDSVRVRRTYVAGLAEQAEQRQREEVERAQRSVAEERLQIARELHDVVAHSLSVIAVQSGVGRHVIDSQPAEAKRALAAVEATSRSALDELRRMLGVLRRDDGQPAALAPAPGVGALGPLVEQVRLAGYTVDLVICSNAVTTLSPAVELSLYRIIQEALTNVVKHAGPARVHVEIRDDGDALVLEVTDNGRGLTRPPTETASANGGEAHHGIVGMRERVALYDGSLSVGARPEGGFRVSARLPFDALAAS